jgi:hypothetical protein
LSQFDTPKINLTKKNILITLLKKYKRNIDMSARYRKRSLFFVKLFILFFGTQNTAGVELPDVHPLLLRAAGAALLAPVCVCVCVCV